MQEMSYNYLSCWRSWNPGPAPPLAELPSSPTRHNVPGIAISVSCTLSITWHERCSNYSLVSTLDPLLGIFTGAFAYYLHETNPRTAPAPEQKLDNLVRWKIEKYRADREK